MTRGYDEPFHDEPDGSEGLCALCGSPLSSLDSDDVCQECSSGRCSSGRHRSLDNPYENIEALVARAQELGGCPVCGIWECLNPDCGQRRYLGNRYHEQVRQCPRCGEHCQMVPVRHRQAVLWNHIEDFLEHQGIRPSYPLDGWDYAWGPMTAAEAHAAGRFDLLIDDSDTDTDDRE